MRNEKTFPVLYGNKKELPRKFFRLSVEYKTVKPFVNRKLLVAITKNAYRILDLNINASESEIIKKAELTKKKIKLGINVSREFGLDLLQDLEIDDNLIIYATNRLLNPKTRLYERFFWFVSRDERFFNQNNDMYLILNDYLIEFYDTIKDSNRFALTDFFNLSLLGIIYLFLDDYYLKLGNAWIDVFNVLLYIIQNDAFIEYLASLEKAGRFSNPIDYKKEEIKNETIMLLIEPLNLLTEEHLRNEKISGVRNGLAIISKLSISDDVRNECSNKILNIIEDDITFMCDKILKECQKKITTFDIDEVYNEMSYRQLVNNNNNICKDAINLYYKKISSKHDVLIEYAKQNSQNKRAREYIADFFYNFAILFTWGDNFKYSYELLKKAQALVIGENTLIEQKIEKMIERITK